MQCALVLQGEQLGRMQSDASSLEQCVRSVEALLGGRASGSAEQELARGGDAAHRCRQWCALAPFFMCSITVGLLFRPVYT